MPPQKTAVASCEEALSKAMEKVKAGEITELLILYSDGDQKAGSFDNDLTVKDSLYLVELFKSWLMRCVLEK